jgi:hypothetical protein
MKKLLFAMASLCLVVSVSSCSADDHFTEDLNSNEIQNKEIVNPQLPSSFFDNGDDDKDKDGDDDKD